MSDKPLFFETPSDFRDWLKKNHHKKEVQWVGFCKVHTGKPGMRWEESVEQALCFGWIDGLRRSIDEDSYKIRFTPRRTDSNWSKKNIETVERLKKEGKMHAAGLEAYRAIDPGNNERYSYEQETVKLKKEYENQIRSNKKAWLFFEELAPSYTRTSVDWVMSAKREETRLRRLQILIESCEARQKIPLLRQGE